MSNQEPSAFQRVFPARELFRGAGLLGLVWSGLASVSLCLLLVDLVFLADLLIDRGEVTISDDASAHSALAAVLEGEQPAEEGAQPRPKPKLLPHSGFHLTRTHFGPAIDETAPEEQDHATTLTDAGILPTLWRYRDAPWAGPAVAQYAWLPSLQANRTALGVLVGLGALLGWLRSLFASLARRSWNSLALEISTRLRKSIHRQALRLGPADLDGGANDQALELFIHEVDRVRDGVFGSLGIYGRDLLRLSLIGSCLLLIDPVFTTVCVVPIVACWYFVERQRRMSDEQVRLIMSRAERDVRILAEGLSKTRLVRGYQMEAYEQEQFQKALERLQKSQSGALSQVNASQWGVRVAVTAVVAFVVLFLGWRVLLPPHGTALASGVVVFAGFLLAWRPLQNLALRGQALEPAQKSAHRIQQYLNQVPEVGQAVGARFLQPMSKMLTFEEVAYTTPGRRALLDGLSFKIPAGRQVALVSTDPLEALAVACLIPRFIEPQAGRILIDGEDIAWVTLDSLRAESIFVGGKDPCISGSVRDNISGGNPSAPLNELTEAAKLTHAHNFIQRLPQGYETIIGEQGEQLDAGQSFRLGLARAILRNPALLIVEEPSTPLDDDAKALLDDAYKRLAQNRTLLFVPRRLSTLRRCDEIVFIHRGKLSAIGPRDRLVQSSPLYRHWEYLNFNEFRHEFETGGE